MARAATDDGMGLDEQVQFLERIKHELKSNRTTIQALSIKSEAFDTINAIVTGNIGRSRIMGGEESLENQVGNKLEELKGIRQAIDTRLKADAYRKQMERLRKKRTDGGTLNADEEFALSNFDKDNLGE